MAWITDKEVREFIAKAQREGKALYQADGTVPGLTVPSGDQEGDLHDQCHRVG